MGHTLSDFDFDLPPELIAQVPAEQRSGSRLLHVGGQRRADLAFRDLPTHIDAGDLVVFNDTRVVKARVHAHKESGGKAELLVERIVADDRAWVQLRASHPPRPGTALRLPGGARAQVLSSEGGFHLLAFETTGPLPAWLETYGEIPLPPYVGRAANGADESRYQTVYARVPGAVAAPTAGLHFDDAMLAALASRGVASAFVTLHVGAGTFLPVRHDDLALHRMHTEFYTVPPETVAAIAAARVRSGRVLAVGTTTLRALESAALPGGGVREGAGETALFITPGYRFAVVDRLLTNFHLPRSTLLMLVCAFAGYDAVHGAYAHAIAERYRFFSYGDALLLERDSAAGPAG